MSGFLYGIALQWKLDFRNKAVLITYYMVPLVFFLFIGGIFTSTNPESKETLVASMSIFAVSMGTLLGAPLVELYSGDVKKAFKVGGIPLWFAVVNNFISAFVHLMITTTIIFFVAPIAFKAKIPENIPLYFVSLAVFLIVCSSVGTILGLYIKSTSKLTMFSQMIFLPSLMLSGIMFPTTLLPEALQTAGKIFPATWGFKVLTLSSLDIKMYIPLLAIFIVSIVVNVFKVSKMSID